MMSAQILSERLFSDDEPSGWYAGENPTTLRFTYTGSDWTTYFSSAGSNFIELTSASVLNIVVGDSFKILYSTFEVTVSITRITTIGAAFTYQLYFSPPFAYVPTGIIGITRWVGRNDYVEVEYREDDLTGVTFFRQNIKVGPNGIGDCDISKAMRAFNGVDFSYDFSGSINQLQEKMQKNFVIVFTSYEDGLPYSNFIDYKLHSVRAAQNLGNPKSNNLIDYVPKVGVSPHAKWLTRFQTKKVWQGKPNFLSFIFSEYIDNPTLNFGGGSIPLDATQNVGVNHLLLDDSLLVAPNCFWLEGEEPPPPPPPTPPPVRRRELNWHFMNGRRFAKLSVAENIFFVLSDQFQGFFNSGGAIFKINGVASVNLAAFQIDLLSTVPGDEIEIEIVNQSAVNSFFSDEVFYIEYGTLDTTVYPFYRQFTFEFSDARVGCDRMLIIRHRLSFDPSPASHSPMYVGVRTLPSPASAYTDFPYNLSDAADIAALNAVLAAIPDGQPYGLHFWYGWIGKFPSGSRLTSGNIDGSFRYRYLDAPYDENYFIHRAAGEDSFPLDIPELLGNGAVYDGVTRYERLVGLPNIFFEKGVPFWFHVVYFLGTFTGATQRIFDFGPNAPGRISLAWVNGTLRIQLGSGAAVFYIVIPEKRPYMDLQVYYTGGDLTNPNSWIITANGADLPTSIVPAIGQPLIEPATFVVNPNPNNHGIGSANNGSQKFNGRLKKLTFIKNPQVAPSAFQRRVVQNVHDTNGGDYNGAGYFPTVGSDFWIVFDFDKTGAAPITVSSSLALSVTSFGANSYTPFLT